MVWLNLLVALPRICPHQWSILPHRQNMDLNISHVRQAVVENMNQCLPSIGPSKLKYVDGTAVVDTDVVEVGSKKSNHLEYYSMNCLKH